MNSCGHSFSNFQKVTLTCTRDKHPASLLLVECVRGFWLENLDGLYPSTLSTCPNNVCSGLRRLRIHECQRTNGGCGGLDREGQWCQWRLVEVCLVFDVFNHEFPSNAIVVRRR